VKRPEVGITGASGLVGRTLVRRLLTRGETPRLFGRGGSREVHGVGVGPMPEEASALGGLDVLVHLAGITTSAAPEETLRAVNVELPVALARQAAAAGVRRLVFMSSLHAHGVQAPDPVRPEQPLTPHDAYGRSKAEAEAALRSVCAELGLELAVLRPPMIYGAEAANNFRLLQGLASRGLPLPFGSATWPRSFVSVDNVAGAVERAMAGPIAGVALMPADPEDLSTRELTKLLAEGAGAPSRLLPAPRPLLGGALKLAGKSKMAISLLEPLAISREHWGDWGWAPEEDGREAVRRASAAMSGR